PEEFVEAARGRVEAALREVATAINRAPTADLVSASEEEVRRLFGELWWDVLELGARLRVDAALAQFPPAPGGWAAKYRRMVVQRDCPALPEDAPTVLAVGDLPSASRRAGAGAARGTATRTAAGRTATRDP